MSASPAYIARLESHARHLREVNANMAERALAQTLTREEWRAVGEAMGRNQVEAERYEQQALWHRHDNGEFVICRPQVKPWRD